MEDFAFNILSDKDYLIPSFFSNIYRKKKCDENYGTADKSHYLQHAEFIFCRWNQNLWFIGGIKLVQSISR